MENCVRKSKSTLCCVPACGGRGGHVFPKNKHLRRLWELAVRRGGKGDRWKGPTARSVVCKRHFKAEDFESKTSYGTTPLIKRLKKGVVPTQYLNKRTPQKSPAALKRNQRYKIRDLREMEKRTLEEQNARKELQFIEENVAHEEVVQTEPSENKDGSDPHVCRAPSSKGAEDVSTQTMNFSPPDKDVSTQTQCSAQMVSTTKIADNDGLLHFYTGLETYEKFSFVLYTLGPAQNHLEYYKNIKPRLCVEDQFLLTLMRLRRNYTNFELSNWFNVSDKVVTSCFITWINFMFYQWGEINWFPTREDTKYYANKDFRATFPDARITLDATEVPIMKPHEPILQQATYSTYKNRNTLKVMVGTTPGGLVSYVSPVYGGSTSDRQIIERSDILAMCNPGDMILADKGINIEDLTIPHNITLNIPTFFKKKNRMNCHTVQKDRKCSSKRVHVERHIGAAKTFKMISTTNALRPMEVSLGEQIITVCFYLTNFRRNIIK